MSYLYATVETFSETIKCQARLTIIVSSTTTFHFYGVRAFSTEIKRVCTQQHLYIHNFSETIKCNFEKFYFIFVKHLLVLQHYALRDQMAVCTLTHPMLGSVLTTWTACILPPQTKFTINLNDATVHLTTTQLHACLG